MCVNSLLQFIDLRAARPPLFRWNLSKALEQLSDSPLLAEPFHLDSLQFTGRLRTINRIACFTSESFEFLIHDVILLMQRKRGLVCGQAPVFSGCAAVQASAALAFSTTFLKPAGSFAARSARTLRSISMPARLMPLISFE